MLIHNAARISIAALGLGALILYARGAPIWACGCAALAAPLLIPPVFGRWWRQRYDWWKTLLLLVVSPAVAALVLHEGYLYLHAFDDAAGMFALLRQADTVYLEILNGASSTIYALIVAFIVFKGMQDLDQANFTLRDEAMRLWSVSQYLQYFIEDDDDDATALCWRIRALVLRYARNVLAAQRRGRASVEENERLIELAEHEVARLKPRDANDRVALEGLIRTLDELTTIRSRRIALMTAGASPFLIFLMALLSVLVIAPFFVELGLLQEILVVALGYTLSVLFLLLLDMNSPFDGHWTVRLDAFEHVAERLEDIVPEAAIAEANAAA